MRKVITYFIVFTILFPIFIGSSLRTIHGEGLAESPSPCFGQNARNTCRTDASGEFNDLGIDWNFSECGAVSSKAVVGPNGSIYFGSSDGYLYALNKTGEEKWSVKTGEIKTSPAVSNLGFIYVGTTDGYFYKVNSNGTIEWKVQIYELAPITSPTIGKSGRIYFGATIESQYGVFYSMDPDGNIIGTFKSENWIDSSSAIGNNGTIYFGSWDNRLYAVDQTGDKQWSFKTQGEILGSASVSKEGNIYFGSSDGYIYSLNSEGNLRWKRNIFSRYSTYWKTTIAIGEDRVYAVEPMGTLYSFDKEGNKIWEKTVETNDNDLMIDDSGTIYMAGDGSFIGYTGIYAYDKNGSLLCDLKINTELDMTSPTMDKEGNIYLGCKKSSLISKEGYFYKLSSVLTPPQNLTIEQKRGEVHLEWEKPTNADEIKIEKFNIYRCERYNDYGYHIDKEEYEYYDSVNKNKTTLIDNDVVFGSYYHYRITAEGENGESDLSDKTSIQVLSISDNYGENRYTLDYDVGDKWTYVKKGDDDYFKEVEIVSDSIKKERKGVVFECYKVKKSISAEYGSSEVKSEWFEYRTKKGFALLETDENFFVPPRNCIIKPLRVGKEWDLSSGKYKKSSNFDPDIKRLRYSCLDKREITVGAGTFDVYVIKEYSNEDDYNEIKEYNLFYYSKKVKNIVKSEKYIRNETTNESKLISEIVLSEYTNKNKNKDNAQSISENKYVLIGAICVFVSIVMVYVKRRYY